MKAELAPKHTQQVGTNYVLWFESSNSYVVLSPTSHSFLTSYFESKDKETFFQNLKERYGVPIKEAQQYHVELSGFLSDVNSGRQTTEFTEAPNIIPEPNISNHYAFGDSLVGINYSSDKLRQLIHPHLEHASIETTCQAESTFDIFGDAKHLHLFKNKLLIGSYETKEFHFLQGKFAMELTASIYNNTESDWLATFHASTICNEKESIMIIGDSGNGKSTLSALLMAHGYDLLADDFTPMLSENQHLYRFPAAISIKKGAFSTIERLFEGFDAAIPQLSSSKPISVKYLPPSKPFRSSQKHFECHKIVMVKYSIDAQPSLQECSSEHILKTFIPDSWISTQPNHSKTFLNWLKNLKFYELTYSDNNFAVNKFNELFDS